MMILNRMMDILWQTQRLWRMVPQEVHEHSNSKFFCDKKYQMLCLQKINYMNYATYIMKIRAYLWRTYAEKYDIFKNLVAEIFF